MNNYEPPFTINDSIINLIARIMEEIGKIKHYQDLDKFPKLRKQNRIRSVYSSCAIEANSLTIDQVTDVINGKQVIGPKREIQEIKNATCAYAKMETLNPFSIEDLLNSHYTLTKYLVDNPGEFRKREEGVFDGDKCIFVAPPASFVPTLMNNLFSWLNAKKDIIHPLILSSVFHYEFVFIHPFEDGNGRLARLWQNTILGYYNPLFYWIPLENYLKDNQADYYDAISKSHIDGTVTAFIEFMLKMILETVINIQTNINLHISHNNDYVKRLLSVMEKDIPMSTDEIMKKLGLKSKASFRQHYLKPAIEIGLIEYEIKDKPTSKNQKYRKK